MGRSMVELVDAQALGLMSSTHEAAGGVMMTVTTEKK